MGLDSVELVMEVEKYFNIQIPNQDAEKIGTVQNIVDCVAKHLSITNSSTELRDTTIDKIQQALLKLGLSDKPLNPADPIFLTLNPKDQSVWDSFSYEFEFVVFQPQSTDRRSPITFFDKLKNKITWDPLYDWDKISVEQFADVVCATNCSVLVDPAAIKSTYEIYVAVVRIIADKMGLEEYEITAEKSLTSDLGID